MVGFPIKNALINITVLAIWLSCIYYWFILWCIVCLMSLHRSNVNKQDGLQVQILPRIIDDSSFQNDSNFDHWRIEWGTIDFIFSVDSNVFLWNDCAINTLIGLFTIKYMGRTNIWGVENIFLHLTVGTASNFTQIWDCLIITDLMQSFIYNRTDFFCVVNWSCCLNIKIDFMRQTHLFLAAVKNPIRFIYKVIHNYFKNIYLKKS